MATFSPMRIPTVRLDYSCSLIIFSECQKQNFQRQKFERRNIMKLLSSTVRIFISGIFLTALTSCTSSTTENKPEVQIPPCFETLKDPADDTGGYPLEIRHKDTGIEMVYVAPGEFMMGSPPSEKDRRDDETMHKVTLIKGYYIGKYEVTQEQWEKVMGNNPSKFKGVNLPVEQVKWDDCQSFCKKIGSGFRLPTEAEWEYAARGGNRSQGFIYSGRDNLDEVGWHNGNNGDKTHPTHPVGQKKSNELGLYDMSGNVYEWCGDWYGDYPSWMSWVSWAYPVSVRVDRGGCWFSDASHCRSACRYRNSPDDHASYLGFRLAMDIPMQK